MEDLYLVAHRMCSLAATWDSTGNKCEMEAGLEPALTWIGGVVMLPTGPPRLHGSWCYENIFWAIRFFVGIWKAKYATL